MSAFLLKPCKGSRGFQGISDRNLKLDLATLEGILEDADFTKKVAARIIMVLEKEGLEFTIYPSGKFLIKPSDPDDDVLKEKAEEEAEKLVTYFKQLNGDKSSDQ